MWFKKRKPESTIDPAETARSLREQAFSVTAAELGVASSPDRPTVWGLVMETGYPEAVATLVAFAEGTTSLYFSNGGGIIGGGSHENVRRAAMAWLDMTEDHVNKFSPTMDHPPPEPGRVRFYVRTFGRLLTAEASEDDLGYERHELSPVFHAGHAVISQIREIDSSRH